MSDKAEKAETTEKAENQRNKFLSLLLYSYKDKIHDHRDAFMVVTHWALIDYECFVDEVPEEVRNYYFKLILVFCFIEK